MRFRSWARTGAVTCVAAAVITAGCGGKSAAAPDSAVVSDGANSDDAAADDAPARDARLPDGGPTTTAITIRTYADGFPSFTGITENVPLLAFQDGDGAWMSLSGTGGVYHATASGQRYGVAVGCGLATASLTIYYQSLSDATDLAVDGCIRPPADAADVAISVLNGDGRQNTVSVGVATAAITSNGTAHLAVPKRMADVFAVSVALGGGPPSTATVYRGPTLNVTANTSLSIDIASALELENHPLTVVDIIPAGHSETFAEVQSKYYTANSYGQRALFQQPLSLAHPATIATTYRTLAAASRQTDDMMYARARTRGTTPSGVGYDRVVDIQTASAVSLTMTLPDVFAADVPVVDNAPIPRATATLPMRPPTLGNALYNLDLVTTSGPTTRTVDVVVRPGWAQGMSTVTVTTPDLSSLPGWTADMALLPDTNVNWTILIDDRNIVYGAPVTDGKRILETFLFATIERQLGPSPSINALSAAGGSCSGACADRGDRFAR